MVSFWYDRGVGSGMTTTGDRGPPVAFCRLPVLARRPKMDPNAESREVAMEHSSGRPQEEPLQSWKEIAAYLKRDVRTVLR